MTSRTTIKLIFLQLLFLISTKSFSQNSDKLYNHETAVIELDSLSQRIKSGLPYKINSTLIQYIYNQQDKFPEIPENLSSRVKMGIIAPIFTQTSLIMKSQLNPPQDSISKEEAMLAATTGYQSIKIISLSNEFLNTLDEDSYNYKTRLRGFNQGVKGLQEFLLGYTTMTFLENQNQTVDDILISSLLDFAPKIINEFPIDKKESTIDLLKSSIEGEEDIRLINEFNNFIKSLK
ncbi:hypothetical protein [Aquimarina aquimarini]|uniref:hypothetical protein n=1 Tax=Aquimarina aquimarini TaxID=1191734 RepID=UPI000D54E45D|nr:hypothetical protein [Aquimarina aquimarini]